MEFLHAYLYFVTYMFFYGTFQTFKHVGITLCSLMEAVSAHVYF